MVWNVIVNNRQCFFTDGGGDPNKYPVNCMHGGNAGNQCSFKNCPAKIDVLEESTLEEAEK